MFAFPSRSSRPLAAVVLTAMLLACGKSRSRDVSEQRSAVCPGDRKTVSQIRLAESLTDAPLGLAELRAALTGLLKRQTHSYRQTLRDAAWLMRRGALGRNLEDVIEALDGLGTWETVSDNEMGRICRLLFAPEAPRDIIPGGRYRFFVEAWGQKTGVARRQAGSVGLAEAGALIAVGETYPSLTACTAVREDPLWSVVLFHHTAARIARDYPLVDSIRVSYKRVDDRWDDAAFFGFRGKVTFTTSDGSSGQDLDFEVRSGLDPEFSEDTGLPLSVDFEPRDLIRDWDTGAGLKWIVGVAPSGEERRFYAECPLPEGFRPKGTAAARDPLPK